MAKDIMKKNKNLRCLKRKEGKQHRTTQNKNKKEERDKHKIMEVTTTFYEIL